MTTKLCFMCLEERGVFITSETILEVFMSSSFRLRLFGARHRLSRRSTLTPVRPPLSCLFVTENSNELHVRTYGHLP